MNLALASLLLCLVPQTFGTKPSQSLLDLQSSFTQGLGPVTLNGAIPGVVMAYGEKAVVLASAKSGRSTQAAIVAAEYGQGKAAAYGHGAMLDGNASHGMNTRLFKWLYSDQRKIGWMGRTPIGISGLGRVSASRYENTELRTAMEDCSLLVVGNDLLRSVPSATADLQKYVERGGAILIMDTPWGWLQLNPGKTIRTDHPGQKLLAPMGIGFADGMLDSEGGKMTLTPAQPEHHAKNALTIFESGNPVTKQASGVLSNTLIAVVTDSQVESEFGKRIRESIRKVGTKSFPLKGKPMGIDDFRGRVGAAVYDQEWRLLPAKQVKAHPAAVDFPGLVGQAETRDSAIVSLDGGKRRWWSTGRYAAPGERVQLRLGAALTGKRISLRIGGHSDTLWHLDSWERFPSISLEIPVTAGVAEATNPFGGLVYVVSNEVLPKSNVTISGTVEAPTYFLGKTSATEWNRIRKVDVPWGEIVGKQSAISVPNSVLKGLEKPDDVARYWDEMVREAEKFYAVPAGTTEHRYQVDRQISAGYMHAGYPIMTWEDVSQRFVDLKVLRGKEGNPNWGFYHELGHNYQEPEWTWSGWGEVTNNLFSVFACLHYNGSIDGHGAMSLDQVTARLVAVKSEPGAEKYYEKDPWFGLTFWMEIHREFGFDPMTKLFDRFQKMPGASRPRSDQARRDAFLVEMSDILGRDLSRYCRMWGVGCSPEAETKASVHREWLPQVWRSD